jgi:hypothetical protein
LFAKGDPLLLARSPALQAVAVRVPADQLRKASNNRSLQVETGTRATFVCDVGNPAVWSDTEYWKIARVKISGGPHDGLEVLVEYDNLQIDRTKQDKLRARMVAATIAVAGVLWLLFLLASARIRRDAEAQYAMAQELRTELLLFRSTALPPGPDLPPDITDWTIWMGGWNAHLRKQRKEAFQAAEIVRIR